MGAWLNGQVPRDELLNGAGKCSFHRDQTFG